ncbi:SMP-30/gluconolactonase/LRE family protein [Cohnella abietis]|uniref:SMP-30/gluconolactonase/LRE family protein n=1 Tax=Cohnella abietis TaxID=2507935 RepID=UPI00102E98CB|nr:SMP-30/gluconolactonase/LRE family protein [Cohnella abietis]
MQKGLEVIEGTISTLGEGPVWLAAEKTFYWVDIIEKQIRFYKPETNEQWTIQAEQYVGAAVPAGQGRLLCALKDGFYFLDVVSGKFEKIVNPEEQLANNRFNDGKCDRSGRFWAGSMSLQGEEGTGALYSLESDGTVRKVLTDINCSNGLGWSLDDSEMYYIDTNSAREVQRFSYNPATGAIADKKIIVKLSEGQGYPDGMTVDAEGMIWVAHWEGNCVTRWNPNTGEQIDQINLPVSQVTSCCFGGEQLDELYITSAREGLSEEQLREEPLAGSCFRYKPGVKGLPVNEYKSI